MEFEMSKPDDRVEYDFWYTSSSDKALDFISDFAITDHMLASDVLITPHFVFWECRKCDEEFKEEHCFADGKYCGYEKSYSNGKVTGRDILIEDLRQKCLYDLTYQSGQNRHSWWTYMKEFHMLCHEQVNEDCSRQAHKKASADYEATMRCVRDSFSTTDWGSKRTKNTILDEERKLFNIYGAGFYPFVVINNITYRGQINPLNVYNALCAGFANPPKICE